MTRSPNGFLRKHILISCCEIQGVVSVGEMAHGKRVDLFLSSDVMALFQPFPGSCFVVSTC